MHESDRYPVPSDASIGHTKTTYTQQGTVNVLRADQDVRQI